MSKNYGVTSIKHFKGIEGIRKRPNVYIGATNENGIIHLCKEAIDNSCDEFLAGHAKSISITVYEKEQLISIIDDGRGMPICDDVNKIKKVKEFVGAENIVQKLLCDMHAGKILPA